MKKIELLGLEGIGRIKQADDLAEIIVRCAADEIGPIEDKDIIVLTSKIVSKAAGRTRKLSDVKPGKKARALSTHTGKDARWLQMIFDQGHKILAILPLKGAVKHHILGSAVDKQQAERLCESEQAICITRAPDGRIHTCDAGIDGSNHPSDFVSLLPQDPDKAARDIRAKIKDLTGKEVAVILADTEVVPFGTMDFAIGSAGIEPLARAFGAKDLFGKPKFGGIDLVAHELTAAAALLFGQTDAGIPVVLIRGCDYVVSETAGIGNSVASPALGPQTTEILKDILRATSYAHPLKYRLLLRALSWFV